MGVVSNKRLQHIKNLVDNELSNQKISNKLNIAESSVRRYLRMIKERENVDRENVKILLLDIETAPLEAYVWHTGQKVSIQHYQIKEPWFILS